MRSVNVIFGPMISKMQNRFPVFSLRKGGVIVLLFLFSLGVRAQHNVGDTAIFMSSINVSYGAQFPGGDLSDRFGYNSNLGIHAIFKTSSNWMFGLEGGFIFGRELKEDTLINGLFTSTGNIINNAGGFTRVIANERGFNVSVTGGRLFQLPKIAPNTNSGLEVRLGIGYIQHKIRYDVEDDNVPSLSKEYKKGYDRLTGGLLATQYIGYRHFGNSRYVNFFFGLEMFEGFTSSLRTWNFDTNTAGDTGRLDLLYTLRAGWSIPIYKRAPDDIYLY